MMDSRRTQYVVWNMEQGLSDSEKLQARNNIGAAALASLAPAFNTSTAYTAGAVVTYGGALWMFDANHSGAWTGADAHEVTIFDVLSRKYTPFDSITDWIDISNEFTLANGFTSTYAGQDTKKIYYSPSQNILYFDPICRFFRNTQIPNDWVVFLKYTGNRFYTTETYDQDKYPKKYGVYNGVTLYYGTLNDGDLSQKYVFVSYTGNPSYPNLQGLSVETNEAGNYGVTGPIAFRVTPK